MHKGINTTLDEGQTLIPTIGAGFDVAHSLRADGFDASEDGTGRGTPIVPIAFPWQQGGTMLMPIDDDGSIGSLIKSQSYAVAIQERAICENMDAGPGGKGWSEDGTAYTLEARNKVQAVAYGLSTQQEPKWAENLSPTLAMPSKSGGGQVTAVAFAQNQRDELRLMDVAGALASEPGMKQQTYLHTGWRVRRLTPEECEALQGFPRGYTNIPYCGKNGAPDGPRYKALGNSMAVNAMRWIGRRIEMVDAMETTHV
jgi:DNA (cytosine-5)-methyltransferase 1